MSEKLNIEAKAEEVKKVTSALPEKYRAEIKIVDQASLDYANQALLQVKKIRKRISEIFDPIIEDTRKAWKTALAKKAEVDKPAEEAEDYIKGKIGSYYKELDQRRREAEEEERRRQEEQKKKEEEALKKALEAQEKGDLQEAAKIIEEAVIPEASPQPIIKPEEPVATAGIRTWDDWRWRLKDISKVPIAYLQVNDKMITAEVKRSKEGTNIPGIEVYVEKVVAAKG